MTRRSPSEVAGETLRSIGVALIISALLIAILRPVYEKEQAEREAVVREWIAEQKEADRQLQAEMEAEKLRWDAIEEAERAAARETTVQAPTYTTDDYFIPDDVEKAARYWGGVYDIEPEFLEAVAWAESRFDPKAENGGCIGLMQVAPVWHTERAESLGYTVDDLWTVDGSMAVAADYLAELKAAGHDDYWILMTYNGDSNAEDYLNLTAGPSEYALQVVDVAFELIQTHKEGGSASWLGK